MLEKEVLKLQELSNSKEEELRGQVTISEYHTCRMSKMDYRLDKLRQPSGLDDSGCFHFQVIENSGTAVFYKIRYPKTQDTTHSPGAKYFFLKICCTPLSESYFCI